MTLLSRLRWQCRRGTLELDLLLQDFVDRHYLHLGADEQQAFERLLDQPDETLWSWVSHAPPDADAAMAAVLERLRA